MRLSKLFFAGCLLASLLFTGMTFADPPPPPPPPGGGGGGAPAPIGITEVLLLSMVGYGVYKTGSKK